VERRVPGRRGRGGRPADEPARRADPPPAVQEAACVRGGRGYSAAEGQGVLRRRRGEWGGELQWLESKDAGHCFFLYDMDGRESVVLMDRLVAFLAGSGN
jgi:hypothetical protein